ncbi:patatin-like phospholipase family protein [Fontimonas sp. SYSU GA230001]|uniref:patatin-like phospholipase family protein n=1 Tax=Fontimonas sp. SYSU GA230001 TaxID=3142450 RepID=UPI0032B37663
MHARTAWILAGGGSLGAVQVGSLQALIAAGLCPDLVVGASVGAINAAYLAGRPDSAGMEALASIWRGLRRQDVFPLSWIDGLRTALGRRSYLISPSALGRVIDAALPYARLEKAAIPIHVVATDLLTGEAVSLSEGSARTALLASAAIPSVFPAVTHQGRTLIDGGVTSNTPIAEAIALGAERLIVLPTGFSCASDDRPQSAWAMALHAINLLIMRQLVRDVALHGQRAEIVIVPPLCPLAVNVFDFDHGAELIDRARDATAQWLDHGGIARPGVPDSLRPHHHGS